MLAAELNEVDDEEDVDEELEGRGEVDVDEDVVGDEDENWL